MNKVLVTGAAGFIGSHLSDMLLEDGSSVIGFDNLFAGNMSNLSEAKKNKNFSFVNGDVSNPKEPSEKLDAIVHLAAAKIPKHYSARTTLEVNTIGTKNMLELARKNDSLFVFSSTSDVYGKNPNVPFSEEADMVLGPSNVKRWAYAASKIFDEHLIHAYHEDYGLPFVILRYFNSFGTRNSVTWTGGPISLFIQACIDKKPITIHGDGSQKRCFCYVKDTVRGTFLSVKKKSAWNEVYNIGNDKTEMSIKEIAELTMKVSGTKVPLDFVPHEKVFGKFEEVSRRVPIIDKARERLEFEPEYSLEEGIKLTYEWQKNLK